MRGIAHPDLDYPPLPPIFAPCAAIHRDLDGSPLTYQEFSAYAAITGTKIDAVQIGIIKDIDYIKRAALAGRTVNQIVEAFNYG